MLSLLIMIQLAAHDFHVSIAQVEYKNRALQTTVRLFTDDLEAALEKECDCRIFLGTEREHEQANQYLREYIQKHFRLESPQQNGPEIILGKEVEMELTFVYIEYPMTKAPAFVKVTNSLLFELFSDQRNIVNLTVSEELESAFLTPKNPTETLTF